MSASSSLENDTRCEKPFVNNGYFIMRLHKELLWWADGYKRLPFSLTANL